MAKNYINSDPYWKEKKRELDALSVFHKKLRTQAINQGSFVVSQQLNLQLRTQAINQGSFVVSQQLNLQLRTQAINQGSFVVSQQLNLQLRTQTINQGSFVVSQQLNDAHLTIPELRQNLGNNDDSVPRKIISMAKNYINSDPYWKDKKRELDALSVFRKKEFGDLIAYFETNRCAEFHWVPLHEIIMKYYLKISCDDEKDVRVRFFQRLHI